VLVLTLERYTAVCKSLEARHICTRKRAIFRSILVILASVSLSFPFFFSKSVYKVYTDYEIRRNPFGSATWYRFYEIWAYPTIQVIVPFLLISVLNLLILFHVSPSGFKT
jgi:hypothetical protein